MISKLYLLLSFHSLSVSNLDQGKDGMIRIDKSVCSATEKTSCVKLSKLFQIIRTCEGYGSMIYLERVILGDLPSQDI